MPRRRIFISYNHSDPDRTVAGAIQQAFREEFDIFIDKDIPIGEKWAHRIDRELANADFLIPLLSRKAVASEMVVGEIAKAHRISKETGGKPRLLPVRVVNRDPFPYPLDCWLDPLQWGFWEADSDTSDLIRRLARAIGGGALDPPLDLGASPPKGESAPAPIAPLEGPEEVLVSKSPYYVSRKSDQLVLAALQRTGVTVNIKGCRQMGKSSLLGKALEAARLAGKRTATLDFQLLDRSLLATPDPFFRWFIRSLADALQIEDRHVDYWDDLLTNTQRCGNYMQRYILKTVDRPLALAIDEVDRVLEADFSLEFFTMLRSWHENRRDSATWRQLDLVLVISTDPYLLIDARAQSPFNVGRVVELEDFDEVQLADLNRRHGAPFDTQQLQKLHELIGGHPYLVRRALFLVANEECSSSDLLKRSADDRGPFGDHLRFHLYRLERKPELVAAIKAVIAGQRFANREVLDRLRGAGLIREEYGKEIPRCKLYADYFGGRL